MGFAATAAEKYYLQNTCDHVIPTQSSFPLISEFMK